MTSGTYFNYGTSFINSILQNAYYGIADLGFQMTNKVATGLDYKNLSNQHKSLFLFTSVLQSYVTNIDGTVPTNPLVGNVLTEIDVSNLIDCITQIYPFNPNSVPAFNVSALPKSFLFLINQSVGFPNT